MYRPIARQKEFTTFCVAGGIEADVTYIYHYGSEEIEILQVIANEDGRELHLSKEVEKEVANYVHDSADHRPEEEDYHE